MSTTFLEVFTANPLNSRGPLFHAGRGGDGTVTVRNAGELRVIGDGAFVAVSRGNSDITDPVPSDGNIPALAAQSELFIENGGKLLIDGLGGNASFVIGFESNANGRAVITGPDSLIHLTGTTTEFFVGREGIGILEVTLGGAVEVYHDDVVIAQAEWLNRICPRAYRSSS